MFIHNSGVVPKAAASRIAIAAEIPALPFNTRDSVTRVTRRCAAAMDTARSPRYSRRTSPGCGGLCMRIRLAPVSVRFKITELVIVLIVNEDSILAFKLERQTPSAAHADRPVTFEFRRQPMKLPTWSVHIFRLLRVVQRKQLQAELVGMLRLNPGFRTSMEELLYASMPEALDHLYSVTLRATLINY